MVPVHHLAYHNEQNYVIFFLCVTVTIMMFAGEPLQVTYVQLKQVSNCSGKLGALRLARLSEYCRPVDWTGFGSYITELACCKNILTR